MRPLSVDANVGRSPWQVLSCVGLVWRTHRGGLVPRVFTERCEGPLAALNLCVMITRRYCLGEGNLVSTHLLLLNVLRRPQVSRPTQQESKHANTFHKFVPTNENEASLENLPTTLLKSKHIRDSRRHSRDTHAEMGFMGLVVRGLRNSSYLPQRTMD